MNIYKAAEIIAEENLTRRVFITPTEKRYCAKCKTELSWTYAESRHYIIYCEKCKTKTIVTACNPLEAANRVGVEK
jgi:hypothetical protein